MEMPQPPAERLGSVPADKSVVHLLFVACVGILVVLHQPFLRSLLWGPGLGRFTGLVVRIVRSWGIVGVSS